MKTFLTATALAVLSLGGAAAASAQNGPLYPRNECTGVPGLGPLDSKLREAARTRDKAALLALVDDTISLDFGGGSGKAELAKRLTSPDYRLWDELDRVLKLGCGFTPHDQGDQSASWPWYFHKSLGQGDPYETYLVTGSRVRLRSGPSLGSRVIGNVSWDYVFMSDFPKEGARFAKVRTRSGRTGYISVDYLRSEVDYRLVAGKEGGKWTITAFIAGD